MDNKWLVIEGHSGARVEERSARIGRLTLSVRKRPLPGDGVELSPRTRHSRPLPAVQQAVAVVLNNLKQEELK